MSNPLYPNSNSTGVKSAYEQASFMDDTAEEMARDHAALPHGGAVLRAGKTGLHGEHRHTVEYRLTLDSNPEFTGGVLVALARAVDKMARRGETGCRTVFDVAPAELSSLPAAALRARVL